MAFTVENIRTFDKIFASQQGLWSSKFVQNAYRQYTDNWILIKKKCLNKKVGMTGSIKPDSGKVVIHAVTQCSYACQHQRSWEFRTQPKRNHENSSKRI